LGEVKEVENGKGPWQRNVVIIDFKWISFLGKRR
jgi:hypothetical protein